MSYPDSFRVWPVIRGDGTHQAFKAIRFADLQWAPETYAGGGVVIRVYPKDAASPAAWISKHEGDFFDDVEKINSTTFQGYPAATFEQNHPQEGLHRGRTLVFFRGQLVFTFFGWTATPEYWTVIEPIWTDMAQSHQAE